MENGPVYSRSQVVAGRLSALIKSENVFNIHLVIEDLKKY